MLLALPYFPPAYGKESFVLVIEETTDVIEREQFEVSSKKRMNLE